MSNRVTVREYQTRPGVWVVDADFAHRLADELEKAKERIEQLEGLLAGEKWISEDRKALAEVIRIVEANP
jgi:phenylacetate-coenzyme A ligase PaaK-like adenylate-forming protein